ncbi:hypothetical protein [Lacipirellula sp.]|uniref:hypothetical protein n=1 Tax=Lacipirellula sp. TaxID=2691419 RepID=UPI003D0ED81E
MRAEIRETAEGTGIVGSRRARGSMASPVRSDANIDLQPHAVDAAFADESMPMLKERGSRRDSSHTATESQSQDDLLLESLSAQLELLHEQQREIRLLLDQAGRRRVDRVAN